MFALIFFSTLLFLVAAETSKWPVLWYFWSVSLLTYLTLVSAAVWLYDRINYFVIVDCKNGMLIKRNLFSKSSNRVIPFDQIMDIHTINLSWDECGGYQVLEMTLMSKERVLFMDCGNADLRNTRRIEHILRRAIFEKEKRVEILLRP